MEVLKYKIQGGYGRGNAALLTLKMTAEDMDKCYRVMRSIVRNSIIVWDTFKGITTMEVTFKAKSPLLSEKKKEGEEIVNEFKERCSREVGEGEDCGEDSEEVQYQQ